MSQSISGLRAWIFQRITAIYLAVFVPIALGYLLFFPVTSYQSWIELLSSSWVNTSLLLFVFAILLHGWIGIRDVVIDYVQPFPARMMLLVLVGLGLIVCGVWAARILFNVKGVV
ncbi:MAG: succinate dehydrogenase, hydrophobic membrane anchor protein [gamma proteobacterium endosymbiont of Lamellibrachia anaximandri]|nr:succinate dehydrogenase, hydrophobic membrane anchor protein [gamma proteobacterium endosymbiont of Lamellibrachia anaximandri]MBL3535433.1 succinate dehydrogenase, hydrophobic membrane anchor protein [gamma proteobacterium endosymbiont of Lamellibrachia anaximandri]MBL3599596.1 succinate dehydrogenase, hydrophobic membrane anchor protein [gamma proteobacterium endosymbiont of Lamellibrachia anaximandri]